jgi:Zn-dependent M32 family carboxypeptidase
MALTVVSTGYTRDIKKFREFWCSVKTGRHMAAQLVQAVNVDHTKLTSDMAAGEIASVLNWRWLSEGMCQLSVAMS